MCASLNDTHHLHHMSFYLLLPQMPCYSKILISSLRDIKRSHCINSIIALPFLCSLSFSLSICQPPHALFITWAIGPTHYYTTPGPLSSLAFFKITFSEQERAEGTRTIIQGWDRGAISQRERWSACSLVPVHTHSLKVRGSAHLIFPLTNNLEERAFKDTEVMVTFPAALKDAEQVTESRQWRH